LEEISAVHSSNQISKLHSICAENDGNPEAMEEISSNYDSVYFNSKTYDTALSSCGCAVELTLRVLEGSLKNGMAIIRPPGKEKGCVD
jgi:histone deacetylase 6